MSTVAQRSFGSGEVGPAVYARSDLARYASSVKTLLNGVVMRSGGIQSRPGTTYKGTTESNGAARLVQCVFDDDQNYVLEFGNLYVRFWKDGALVQATTIGWIIGDVYASGIAVLHNSVRYLCTVGHIAAAATEPGIGGAWATVWVALADTNYRWPTPYVSADLATMQFQASSGVLRIVHKNYARRALYRISNTHWVLQTVPTPATIAAPTGLATTAAAGLVVSWTVTAVDALTGTESAAPAAVTGNTLPSSGSPFTQSWLAVAGATSYRIYKSLYGSTMSFVREQTGLSWIDNGSEAMDPTITPSIQSRAFSVAGTYPSVVGSYQQRVLYSGSTSTPDTVYASKTAKPDEFGVSSPIVISDAVAWRMAEARSVRPRHFLEVARRLIQFSNVGEHVIEGDDTGILGPGAVNPRLISANGAAVTPPPLAVNDSALYVQARGSVVRDLLPATDSGSDLTVAAAHLVDGYTISAWCYQQTPHSVVWAVRSDGVLLSLTYQRESGVLAWARHTTDGTVESIACVPESGEDAVYLIVNRNIGGTKRYIERLSNRLAAHSALVLSDASLTLSGAHPHATLSLDLTSAVYTIPTNTTSGVVATGSGGSGSFSAADVGRTFQFVRSAVTYTATITAYTSPTVVEISFVGSASGWANPTVLTTGEWYWTSLGGLSHLEGKAVSVVLDGAVHASPYNSAYTTRTVTSGNVNLGNTAAFTSAVVGLPFVVDVETLDIDRAGGTIKDRGVQIGGIMAWVEKTRTFWAGPKTPNSATSLSGLEENVVKDAEGYVVATNTTGTGHTQLILQGSWNHSGRVFVRQVDPSPLTLLALFPEGLIGGRS